MSRSTIPQVLAELHDRVAAADIGDAQVFDGQPATDRLRPDVVIVGWSPEHPAVEVESERPGMDRRRRLETYRVHGLVSSLRGGSSMRAPRDRAFALLDAVDGVLGADRTLGGLTEWAQLDTTTVEALQTPEGPTCTIGWVITCRGHTR